MKSHSHHHPNSSAYDTVDYMSLLSESLSNLDFVDVETASANGEDEGDLHKFRLSLATKMQGFNQLVFEDAFLPREMCIDCLTDFSKVSHFTQKRMEEDALNYEESILTLQDSCEDKNDSGVDENVVNSLVDEIKNLQGKCTSLREEDNTLDTKLQSTTKKESECDERTLQIMREINELTYHLEDEQNILCAHLNASIAGEQEIHLLSSPSFSPLFDLCLIAAPQYLVSTIPRCHTGLHILPIDNPNVVLSSNGIRASFIPDSKYNLNWAEINSAWSHLCTAFLCFCNQQDNVVTFTLQNNVETQFDIFSLYSYEIISLRNSVLLIEKKSGEHRNKMEQRRSYGLSCQGHTSSIAPRGCFQEYSRALMALAITVIESAVFYCRLDVMTSFSALNILYSNASSKRAGRQGPDYLLWPSLDDLLRRPAFNNEDGLRALVNDVLVSIYSIVTL